MRGKIVRRMDGMGRVFLPKEFREALCWDTRTEIEIIRQGDRLILQEDPDSSFLYDREKP